MMLTYTAVDREGRTHNDAIEAEGPSEATLTLRQRGLFVTRIEEQSEHASATKNDDATGARCRKPKELALWSRQLCVLVQSGTQVADALLAVERQIEDGPWQNVLAGVRRHVEEGNSLSQAMMAEPDYFDDVTRSLVAAGESSGQLGEMLERIASITRKNLRIRRTVTGALVYPALLLFVGLSATIVMLVGVLPRFAELFETLNAALPTTTSAMLALSELLRVYWWLVTGVIVTVGVGLRFGLATPGGRRMRDQCLVRVPVIGRMVRSLATARIARLLGVMLTSRVPLLEALRLTRHSTGNVLYGDLMAEAESAAAQGESISSIFASSALIMPSVTEAVRHGEQNGQVGPILSDMADFLDEENEVLVKAAMNMLEPAILILMGLVIGTIALSLFIPLFDLTATTGGAP